MSEVETLVVVEGRLPIWFETIAELQGTLPLFEPGVPPPPSVPFTYVETLHIVSAVPRRIPNVPHSRLVVECNVDGVYEIEPARVDELLVHVSSYDEARGVDVQNFTPVYYVPSGLGARDLADALEELARLMVRYPSVVVEIDKAGRVPETARYNYTVCLLVYKAGQGRCYVRDVSYYNIVSYLEGDNTVYAEYPYPPVISTIVGNRIFGCLHAALYLFDGEAKASYTWESYTPCPAMRFNSDPWIYLLKRRGMPVDTIREAALKAEKEKEEKKKTVLAELASSGGAEQRGQLHNVDHGDDKEHVLQQRQNLADVDSSYHGETDQAQASDEEG